MINFEVDGMAVYAEDWESLASLWAKIAMATKSVGGIRESGKNARDNYSYADANDIMGPVRKAMAEANLGYAMQIVEMTRGATERSVETVMKSRHILGDGDTGAFLVSDWASEAIDFGMKDKGINKAATTAQKYFLKRTFLLVTGDDIEDDSDADHGEPVRAKPAPKAAPKTEPKPVQEEPATYSLHPIALDHDQAIDSRCLQNFAAMFRDWLGLLHKWSIVR
jgi:hypothetical protein